MALKVLDAGECLMLSGDSRDEVEGALTRYVDRGAKVVSPTVAVGSNWTAACSLPVRPSDADVSRRMTLAELRQPVFRRTPDPEFDDGCSVKDVGAKCIITGASPEQVMMRIEHLAKFGGTPSGKIVRHAGKWLAMVDTTRMSVPPSDKEMYVR